MEPRQTSRAIDSNMLDAAPNESEWIATEITAADPSTWQEISFDHAFLGSSNGQMPLLLDPSPENVASITQQAHGTTLYSDSYTLGVGWQYPVSPIL